MAFSDEQWLGIVEKFQQAALGEAEWLDALSELAVATGSHSGQLIGLGSTRTVPFNYTTNLGPDYLDDFFSSGGPDPARNPFLRNGLEAQELEIRSSGQFVSKADRRRLPFLAEHCVRQGLSDIGLTPLWRSGEELIGLAVMRTPEQAEISAKERQIFGSLARHVRAAVRTQIVLEQQGARIAAGTLESLSLAAFVCDARGHVRAMSAQGEACLALGGPLRLGDGRLASSLDKETRQLTAAIACAAGTAAPTALPASAVLVLNGTEHRPQVLEVIPLPRREQSFGFDASAVVVVRSFKNFTRVRQVVQIIYGLTAAEADVAVSLAQGLSPVQVARNRGASPATIRTQTRAVYAKVGVSRGGELAAVINALL